MDIREAGIKRRIVGVELIGEPLGQGANTEHWPVMKDGRIGWCWTIPCEFPDRR